MLTPDCYLTTYSIPPTSLLRGLILYVSVMGWGKPRKLLAYYFWCVCDRRNEHLDRYRVKNMALIGLSVLSNLLKT